MVIYKRISRTILRHALPYIFRPESSEELTRLGSRYGGWTVILSRLAPNSVCYSFGAGEDLTFDLALVDAIGCRVHIFDPTPRALVHFDALAQAARGDKSARQQLEHVYQEYSFAAFPMLTFHDIGVWSEDKELDFYEPAISDHVSHSATNIQHTHVGFRATVKSVRSIAEMLGHEQIDLLKMDIEGAELAVIDNLLIEGPLPKTLCIEFDAAAQGGLQELKKMQQLINGLDSAGYRLIHIEDWNFLFIRG